MKSKIKILFVTMLLCVNFTGRSQTKTSIGFDIRGRDCDGGLGLCSAKKMNEPNVGITVQKKGDKTFVLTIHRNAISEDEQISIAGHPFSKIHANLPNKFSQNGDLKFDSEVLKELGLSLKYNLLKKGSYPMLIDDNYVKITLTLSEGGKI